MLPHPWKATHYPSECFCSFLHCTQTEKADRKQYRRNIAAVEGTFLPKFLPFHSKFTHAYCEKPDKIKTNETFGSRKVFARAGEIAWWLKCLWLQHEDLEKIPSPQVKAEPDRYLEPSIGQQNWILLVGSWKALASWLSWINELQIQRDKEGAGQFRKTLLFDFWHPCMSSYMCTCPHMSICI